MRILQVQAFIVAGALALAGASARAQAPAKPTGSNRATVEATLAADEIRINEAYVKGDVATMKRLIPADGFTMDMHGLRAVDDMFAMLATADLRVTEQALTNMKFIWADDNTVVLTYAWTGKGTVNGGRVPALLYASTVWTRRGDAWVALFHQETNAPPAQAKK